MIIDETHTKIDKKGRTYIYIPAHIRNQLRLKNCEVLAIELVHRFRFISINFCNIMNII
jgi:bifunctional DNA-binding transcriptional regulator/antitoxin component of YhaV-PrlF toxin-antitoxin module